ncbi:MAG: ATP-binding cassette domain-containing protein [Clostridia bacterium]|nr:ATP-binding cassette domain-containing protein [Clostridia bacterium]
MPQNKSVVEVKDLKIGVLAENAQDGKKYRFTIDYGSFDINEGDFLLVKGRNGYGKTTFLKLFHLQGVNYFRVAKGDVYFRDPAFNADKSIIDFTNDELTKLNRFVSFVGQEEIFKTGATAYTTIYDYCKTAINESETLTKQEKKQKLIRVAEVIREYFDKYLQKSFECPSFRAFKVKGVKTWSGGQQKMINVLAGIIKAKVCGLKLIVMDEPLNNLDGRNKDILNTLIKELRAEGVAVIAITHCQIFDGINKVLTIVESAPGERKAIYSEREEPAHSECLEVFR